MVLDLSRHQLGPITALMTILDMERSLPDPLSGFLYILRPLWHVYVIF